MKAAMPDNAFQIHQTALELGSKCGVAYEYRYLRRIQTPTSVAAAVGWAGGVIFEVDSPGRDNNQKWQGKAGLGAFPGLTVTFGEHEDKK
jgi:hypothetical protein